MRNIKSKRATKKEIEFLIKNIANLDIFDFFGLARLCGVEITKKEDSSNNNSDTAATIIENGDTVDKTEEKDAAAAPSLPDIRDFYEILGDIINYYSNSKKERRQTIINLVVDCRYENLKKKKRGGWNGIKSENTENQTTLSSEAMQ